MKKPLESPTSFEELENVKRFFIFGNNEFGDRIQLLLSARFPTRFYGYLADHITAERHPVSAFSFRYWLDVLPHLKEGDLVFFVGKNREPETELRARGVRLAYPYNLCSVYSTYELPTFLHFCKKHLKGKEIVLDIGGNTGLTGCILSKFSEHVHIFEPNPEMEKIILNTNFGLSNVSIHMMAISNWEGMTKIYSVGTNNTSMVPKEKIDPIEVPCTTIDSFCYKNKIKPSVIKIDVEGVDGEVILGAMNTITNERPILFFEHPLYNCEMYNTDIGNAEHALSFIGENYDLFAYPTMDMLVDADALAMPLIDFQQRYRALPTNVVALPKE